MRGGVWGGEVVVRCQGEVCADQGPHHTLPRGGAGEEGGEGAGEEGEGAGEC